MPVLATFNLQTKFEMSSFIRCKDMAWAPKCRNESRDPDHAHLGTVSHQKAKTSRGQLVYKIWSSRCRDISGGVKFQNVSRDPDHAQLGNSQA